MRWAFHPSPPSSTTPQEFQRQAAGQGRAVIGEDLASLANRTGYERGPHGMGTDRALTRRQRSWMERGDLVRGRQWESPCQALAGSSGHDLRAGFAEGDLTSLTRGLIAALPLDGDALRHGSLTL